VVGGLPLYFSIFKIKCIKLFFNQLNCLFIDNIIIKYINVYLLKNNNIFIKWWYGYVSRLFMKYIIGEYHLPTSDNQQITSVFSDTILMKINELICLQVLLLLLY